MIIRSSCFETNSSSTHALCIGKGIRLKTPLELVSYYKCYSNYSDSDSDIIDKENQYLPVINKHTNIYWSNKDSFIVELRRFENIGRKFDIYETFESKANFIWTTLIYYYKDSNGEWFKTYHKDINITKLISIFLNELYKYGFKVKFLDIKMQEKPVEYDNWNKPCNLGKMLDEEYIPTYARGKYMIGLQSSGYFPIEEINQIIQNPILLWNLLLGNSKIYTGSDEYDTFEDLNFNNYAFKLVGGSDYGNCEEENIFSYEKRNIVPKLIGNYINGNYETKIYNDGTRIRELLNNKLFYNQHIFNNELVNKKELDLMEPEFPESIDLKITNYCKNNCKYCYAKSNSKGKHGRKEFIKRIISGMHPFTEVAIGGGNAIEHPDLIEILEFAKLRNIICNLTLKDIDIINNKQLIENLYELELVKSIGVSPTTIKLLSKACDILGNNDFVVHLVLGIHGKSFLDKLAKENTYNISKVLFLGYKEIGLGKEFYKDNKESIDKKINELKNIVSLKLPLEVISFDNLAIKQLNLESINYFDKIYQGDDGKFSFYIDAVDETYAKSSLEENKDTIGKLNVKQCFKYL